MLCAMVPLPDCDFADGADGQEEQDLRSVADSDESATTSVY